MSDSTKPDMRTETLQVFKSLVKISGDKDILYIDLDTIVPLVLAAVNDRYFKVIAERSRFISIVVSNSKADSKKAEVWLEIEVEGARIGGMEDDVDFEDEEDKIIREESDKE